MTQSRESICHVPTLDGMRGSKSRDENTVREQKNRGIILHTSCAATTILHLRVPMPTVGERGCGWRCGSSGAGWSSLEGLDPMSIAGGCAVTGWAAGGTTTTLLLICSIDGMGTTPPFCVNQDNRNQGCAS